MSTKLAGHTPEPRKRDAIYLIIDMSPLHTMCFAQMEHISRAILSVTSTSGLRVRTVNGFVVTTTLAFHGANIPTTPRTDWSQEMTDYKVERVSTSPSGTSTNTHWMGSDLRELSLMFPRGSALEPDPLRNQKSDDFKSIIRFDFFVHQRGEWLEIDDPREHVLPRTAREYQIFTESPPAKPFGFDYEDPGPHPVRCKTCNDAGCPNCEPELRELVDNDCRDCGAQLLPHEGSVCGPCVHDHALV